MDHGELSYNPISQEFGYVNFKHPQARAVVCPDMTIVFIVRSDLEMGFADLTTWALPISGAAIDQ